MSYHDEGDPSINHPTRIHVVIAYHALTLDAWMRSDPTDLTTSEAELLSAAQHFGFPVVWGLVEQADPCGSVWPVTVMRPITPVFQALHVGEC
jgi:hypothetical protein